MTASIFTDQDRQHSSLGPHYFAARRIVEASCAALKSEHAKEISDTVVKLVYERIQEVVEASLWSDAEMNLQGKMWSMVDEMVKCILGGDIAAMKRYTLGHRYDCEAVRKAIAKHIPQEIMNARIADLEAENKILQDALRLERELR